jgi:bifunctional non-homologous end joining protein LigD
MSRAARPVRGFKSAISRLHPPALATAVERVPRGERWLHEIKFDGYRVQVHLRDAAVKVFMRRGNAWTNRFRKIAADAWHRLANELYSIRPELRIQPIAADSDVNLLF